MRPDATLAAVGNQREQVIAALSRLVRRRERVRRELAIEAFAGLVGGVACIAVHAVSVACSVTPVLAFAAAAPV